MKTITKTQLDALKEYNKNKSRSVYQFDYKTGKFIAEYSSLREAERVTGVKNNNICLVCKGEKKQAGGLYRKTNIYLFSEKWRAFK